MRALLLSCIGLTGCFEEPAARLEAPVAPVQRLAAQACATVEGPAIGALPLEVRVGGATVALAEWTATDETATTLVGFAAHLPPDVVYTVRAGSSVFAGTSARWLHPAGVVGPRVKGIERITFCRAAPALGDGALALAR
jgi:hypothetical protein